MRCRRSALRRVLMVTPMVASNHRATARAANTTVRWPRSSPSPAARLIPVTKVGSGSTHQVIAHRCGSSPTSTQHRDLGDFLADNAAQSGPRSTERTLNRQDHRPQFGDHHLQDRSHREADRLSDRPSAPKATGSHFIALFLNEADFLVDADPGSSWLLASPPSCKRLRSSRSCSSSGRGS